jgi:ankyrin repeat protein
MLIVQLLLKVEMMKVLETMSRHFLGSTVLMIASAAGVLPLVMYFVIDQHASVNQRNSNGTSALIFACNNGFLDVVEFLCSWGADPTCVIGSGDTPLTIAASAGHIDIVNYLVSMKRIPLETRNNEGKNALHSACESGHASVCAILLQSGADINSFIETDEPSNNMLFRSTAFVLACMHGHIDVIRVLLNYGPDTSLISDRIICTSYEPQDTTSTLTLTQKDCKTLISSILIQAGWRPILDVRYCCEVNNTSVLNALLDTYPCDVVSTLLTEVPIAGGGASGIHVACLRGSVDVLRFIWEMSVGNPLVRVEVRRPFFLSPPPSIHLLLLLLFCAYLSPFFVD